MPTLKAIFCELADILGQLVRQDYGSATFANVARQIGGYFQSLPSHHHKSVSES